MIQLEWRVIPIASPWYSGYHITGKLHAGGWNYTQGYIVASEKDVSALPEALCELQESLIKRAVEDGNYEQH